MSAPYLDRAEYEAAAARDTDAKRGQEIAAANMPHWPEPRPLPETKLAAVAPFDYDLLPGKLRPWVRDIAERMQAAPDFVAVTAVAALGALIGRRVGVRPKQHDDWTEFANMWTLAVGRPGVLKTPSMQAALAPLHWLDTRFHEHFNDEVAAYEGRAVIDKMRRKADDARIEALLKKNPKAHVERAAFEEEVRPELRRLIVNDSTVEKLGEILQANPYGVAVYRDELVSLFRSLEREGQESSRGFYLSGWSGNQSYVWDRIGRGRVAVEAVCLSVIGSTQPGRLSDYLRDATSGGTNDDGLMQRFGLLVWPDMLDGAWQNVDKAPDEAARRAAFDVFDRLMHGLPVEDWHAQFPLDHDGEPDEAKAPYLRLDDAANVVFLEWRAALENELRGGTLHEALEAHVSKYRKLVPGLALIFHLVDVGRGPIGKASMRRAVAWADYLRSHAARAYGTALVTPEDRARVLLEKIMRGRLGAEPFALKRVYDAGWSRLTTREEAAEAVAVLIVHGYLVEIERDAPAAANKGGRPKEPRYRVNPRTLHETED